MYSAFITFEYCRWPKWKSCPQGEGGVVVPKVPLGGFRGGAARCQPDPGAPGRTFPSASLVCLRLGGLASKCSADDNTGHRTVGKEMWPSSNQIGLRAPVCGSDMGVYPSDILRISQFTRYLGNTYSGQTRAWCHYIGNVPCVHRVRGACGGLRGRKARLMKVQVKLRVYTAAW